MIKSTFKASVDGEKIVLYKAVVKSPKAVVQIVHGSIDHATRYVKFVEYLNKQGFSVYLMDIRGHGETGEGKPRGYFHEKDGATMVLADVHDINEMIQKENKGKKIILFGHSMGSFIVRAYATQYGDVDMLIPCGTSHSPKPLVSLLHHISCKKSKKHGAEEGTFLANLSYKAFDKPFKGEGSLAWLSKDKANRAAYRKSPYTNFQMSNKGFNDMAKWMKMFHSKSLIVRQRKIPVLLINGEKDPVGAMGKEVNKAFKFYKKNYFDVKHIQYPTLRHEILNEKEQKDVFKDIVTWIDEKLELHK